jgi:hypothetical protein
LFAHISLSPFLLPLLIFSRGVSFSLCYLFCILVGWKFPQRYGLCHSLFNFSFESFSPSREMFRVIKITDIYNFSLLNAFLQSRISPLYQRCDLHTKQFIQSDDIINSLYYVLVTLPINFCLKKDILQFRRWIGSRIIQRYTCGPLEIFDSCLLLIIQLLS